MKQLTVPYITLLNEGEANKLSYWELSNIEHARLHSEKTLKQSKHKISATIRLLVHL